MSARHTLGLACLLLGAGALPAWADESSLRVPLLPAYKQECGACHTAYAPGLMAAPSWQRLMGNLPRHFGTDASLDAATTKQLSDWLAAYATGKRARETPPEDRITRSAWFARKHDEVAPEVWKRKAIGSAANCGACHTQAAEGSYNERDIRIPR
jgi:hypothetical protein